MRDIILLVDQDVGPVEPRVRELNLHLHDEIRPTTLTSTQIHRLFWPRMHCRIRMLHVDLDDLPSECSTGLDHQHERCVEDASRGKLVWGYGPLYLKVDDVNDAH